MSIHFMSAAFKTEVGNSGMKLVLLKLADSANDRGECWPSYQHIADQCELGRSTVKRYIKQLQSMGIVGIESRNDGKSSNMYHLHLNPVRSEPGPLRTRSTQSTTRSAPDPEPGPLRTPEPSLEPSGTKGGEKAPSKSKQSRFTPPSVGEVREYCQERGNTIDPDDFVNHYEANGWMRGKTKIKDWKACVRTWEKNQRQKPSSDLPPWAGAI